MLLLVGCASQPPELTQYLLRTDGADNSRQQTHPAKIGLGRVHVATYIDQPGLVLETEDGQIQAARHHQWAEPLRISLRRFLGAEISAAVGQDLEVDMPTGGNWEYRIDITIDQLHGTADGNAVLMAYWVVTNLGEGGARSRHQFAATEALQRDGFDALAEAEKILLTRLANAVSDSLKAKVEFLPK
jgi:uncharacterized lipoprotein YmbA